MAKPRPKHQAPPRSLHTKVLPLAILAWVALSVIGVGYIASNTAAPLPGLRHSSRPARRLGALLWGGDASAHVQAGGATASPAAGSPAPAGTPRPDRRVSGLGPPLSDAELHGGWRFNQSTWDRVTTRALRDRNVTIVSVARPRLVLVSSFLNPGEVEHLAALAGDDLARSEVVSAEGDKLNQARTSYGAWLNGAKRDDVVLAVQHRIHDLVGIPEEFGESLYVLRYADGQRYEAHTDHCTQQRGQPGTPACREFLARAGGPDCGPGAGGVTCGDRLATVILYLRTPARGGATVFPHATRYRLPLAAQALAKQLAAGGGPTAVPQQPAPLMAGAAQQNPQSRRLAAEGGAATPAEAVPSYCQDSVQALRLYPEPGSAVVFYDYVPPDSPDASVAVPDMSSLHGGCPVLEGTKLIATRWIRASEFH